GFFHCAPPCAQPCGQRAVLIGCPADQSFTLPINLLSHGAHRAVSTNVLCRPLDITSTVPGPRPAVSELCQRILQLVALRWNQPATLIEQLGCGIRLFTGYPGEAFIISLSSMTPIQNCWQ